MAVSHADHPYSAFGSKELQKPARYLGGEFGAVSKDWTPSMPASASRSPTSTTSA